MQSILQFYVVNSVFVLCAIITMLHTMIFLYQQSKDVHQSLPFFLLNYKKLNLAQIQIGEVKIQFCSNGGTKPENLRTGTLSNSGLDL